jgi:hypothetical protein
VTQQSEPGDVCGGMGVVLKTSRQLLLREKDSEWAVDRDAEPAGGHGYVKV